MARLSISSFELGDFERDWFIVMARLGGVSIRSHLSSVVSFYIGCKLPDFKEMLEYTSTKYGLTQDECFRRLLNDEPLGEPVDGLTKQALNTEEDHD